jgi:hypothetical protein
VSDVVVVDDHLLTLHLAGHDAWLPRGARVATTASWSFRLAKALEGAGGGSLSALIAGFTEDDRRGLEDLIRHLPEGITVLHPRDTVPQAAVLSARHGLNLLAADALATALALEAQILVAVHDDGPRLRAAATSVDVAYAAIAL